ncbi:MAG: thioredoxin [Planctomycetaceae bacterium]|nr:thioredoxin [Planctomycetaceae bacterium]
MKTVQHVNESNFRSEVLNSSQPVLVDCFAQWCGPCRMLSPVLDQLAGEFAGRAKVVKVDVDQSLNLARALHVEAMPTLILFQNGREIDRVVGAPPAAHLRRMLESKVTASAS